MLQKQEPLLFDDPEQCLQAHTEAIVKYLAAMKLHQEVNGQDPWTWLAVANSYLEQNPVDLAQLPCATMPDGKRKKHYLEQLRTAELERLHSKTVEITMEQYIEIDDELLELT
jgi:hypothetical protein